MKKIQFIPDSELTQEVVEPPSPIRQHLPQWYKKLPFYEDKSLTWIKPDNMVNHTLKACIPVFDAMTAGYTITLPTDVAFTSNKEYGPNGGISWKLSTNMISEHRKSQYGEMAIPNDFREDPLKWETHWVVKTPPGYSCLFTHPFYRFDLPFITFTGIVDTDVYDMPLNFPFFMKKDFDGVLEKGTPIAQVIPFKRDNWKSELMTHENFDKFALQKMFVKVERFYKKNMWRKKIYD